jgi:hypothetical protein
MSETLYTRKNPPKGMAEISISIDDSELSFIV